MRTSGELNFGEMNIFNLCWKRCPQFKDTTIHSLALSGLFTRNQEHNNPIWSAIQQRKARTTQIRYRGFKRKAGGLAVIDVYVSTKLE